MSASRLFGVPRPACSITTTSRGGLLIREPLVIAESTVCMDCAAMKRKQQTANLKGKRGSAV